MTNTDAIMDMDLNNIQKKISVKSVKLKNPIKMHLKGQSHQILDYILGSEN
jgi:hypothetical protein